VSDAAFDLALPVRVSDAAGHGRRAIVGQQIGIDGVLCRIVDVRLENAFTEIIEDDEARSAAQSPESAFVEFGPDSRVRSPHEEPHGLAAMAEREHEQARPPIAAGVLIPNHGPRAVIHLRFLARRRGDDGARFQGGGAAEFTDEAFDAGVPAGETVIVDQILPDGLGVAALRQ